jgi:hypothetical protein
MIVREDGVYMHNVMVLLQVGKRAKKRGLPQLGTLGAGNHYCEIQVHNEPNCQLLLLLLYSNAHAHAVNAVTVVFWGMLNDLMIIGRRSWMRFWMRMLLLEWELTRLARYVS